MISAGAVIPDAVAVTSAAPAPIPVTRPASSTAATAVSLDAHEMSCPATAWPFASLASAARRSVSPAKSVSTAGVTTTALTDWATVTATEPEADPAVALIVAAPLPAAVTRPDALTVATVAALLAQLTVAPTITLPFWSRTSAVSCTVASRAVNSAVAGLTVTVVGSGKFKERSRIRSRSRFVEPVVQVLRTVSDRWAIPSRTEIERASLGTRKSSLPGRAG